MGWFSRLINRDPGAPAPAPTFKRTTDPNMDSLLWSGSLYSLQSVTGISINQYTAMNAPAVMAAVSMIAEDIAKLPWTIYRHSDGDARREAKDHFLYELLHEPNEWMNGLEFREMLQLGLLLRGNAYAVIIRNGRGVPIRLVPVNPDWCQLWEAPNGDLFYRVTPNGLHMLAMLRDMPPMIPFADMLHIRGFSANGLLGSSRISLAREAIALTLAQEQQAVRWMGNGAKPSGILTTDGKLNKEAAERMAADWKAMHAGLQNSGKTAVFEQGLKWQALSMTSSDLEFIASRTFQMQEICRIFRIPPHMMGELTRSTNNNIQQQAQEYINYTLTGWANRWRQKLDQAFGLRAQGLSVEFDYRELTTADIGTRINNWRTMIMSMMASPDEARISLDLPPRGGDADKLYFPQNMAAEGSQSTGTQPDGGGRPPQDAGPVPPRALNGHGHHGDA